MEIQTNSWVDLETEWPKDPKKQVIFWNDHIGIYAIDSMDGLSESFKRYHSGISELTPFCSDDEFIKHWVSHRYSFTHWAELPKPPS